MFFDPQSSTHQPSDSLKNLSVIAKTKYSAYFCLREPFGPLPCSTFAWAKRLLTQLDPACAFASQNQADKAEEISSPEWITSCFFSGFCSFALTRPPPALQTVKQNVRGQRPTAIQPVWAVNQCKHGPAQFLCGVGVVGGCL